MKCFFFLQGSNFNSLLLSMFLLIFLSICTCCQLAIAQHTGHPASLQVWGKTEYPTRWRPFHSQEGDLILALLHFVPISLSMRTCCFSQHTRHMHIYPTNLKPPLPLESGDCHHGLKMDKQTTRCRVSHLFPSQGSDLIYSCIFYLISLSLCICCHKLSTTHR